MAQSPLPENIQELLLKLEQAAEQVGFAIGKGSKPSIAQPLADRQKHARERLTTAITDYGTKMYESGIELNRGSRG